MAATRALIRRGVKRLHLIALPTSSLQADLLIGAGCVETIETSAVSLGEFGPAPRFTAAVTAGHDPRERRDLPGAACRIPGGGEGRSLHAAARADRLRRAGASPGLEGHRQPVRQRRSDRAAAGDQARRRAVPCAARRPRRQRLDRPRPRARHHGACRGKDGGDGGEASRGQSVRRSLARGRRARRLLRRERSRSCRTAPGRLRLPITTARMRRILPNTRAWPRAPKDLPPISTGTCMPSARPERLSRARNCSPTSSPG